MDDSEFKSLLENVRLRLSEKEYVKIKTDIENILQYFDKLDNVNCEALEPEYHPTEVKSEFRVDIAKEFKEKHNLLKNTKTYRFYVIGPEI